MSTAGMGEGMKPSEREERRTETYYQRETRGEDRVDKDTAQVVTGGSTLEVIAGAGAATLGILGLAGILPVLFVAISCIAIGGGLMFAGGSIAAKYQDILSATGGRHETSNLAETGGGISAETIGGAAGAALGILALVGVEPATLTSVAIIVLGGALMFGAGAVKRLSNVMIESSHAPRHKQRVASESVKGASAMQTVCGLAAIALGILMLVGIGDRVTLSLVAAIILGGGLLLSGLAVGGKMIQMLYRDKKSGEHREYRREPEHHPAH